MSNYILRIISFCMTLTVVIIIFLVNIYIFLILTSNLPPPPLPRIEILAPSLEESKVFPPSRR